MNIIRDRAWAQSFCQRANQRECGALCAVQHSRCVQQRASEE